MNTSALVIGSDATVANFVSRILERANIEVMQAPNGYLGIKMTLAHLPDIILSGHDMPYCSGLDVLQTIRTYRRTRQIPFISLFSTPSSTLSLQHRLHGADATLTSPFGATKVMTTVYDLLKASRCFYLQ